MTHSLLCRLTHLSLSHTLSHIHKLTHLSHTSNKQTLKMRTSLTLVLVMRGVVVGATGGAVETTGGERSAGGATTTDTRATISQGRAGEGDYG